MHFDFDDTLVNVGNLHAEAFKKALEFFGSPIYFDYKELAGQETIAAFKALGFTERDSAYLTDKKRQIFQDLSSSNDITWIDGISDLLDTLDKLDINYSVVSSGTRKRIINILSKLNSVDRFRFIITKEDVSHSKPNPEPYVLAISRSCIQANCSLAVEDSFNGFLSATNAGIEVWQLSEVSNDDYFSSLHGSAKALQEWIVSKC